MAHPFYEYRKYATPDVAAIPRLRELMLQHVDYLRKHPSTKSISVDVNKRSITLYDFFRYMMELGYPSELHFVVMLVNNIPSYLHFDLSVDNLLLPDASVVQEILAIADIS